MPKTYEQVHDTFKELELDYQDRHNDHKKLRDFYHGRYWQQAEDDTRSFRSLFSDLRRKSDVGPDLKLVHNLLQEVVTKFQTYLSPLPMIRVYTDPPESEKRRAQATKKERYLYGQWSQGGMDQILNKAAWYLALMGDCFLGSVPDPETNLTTPILRSPEYAFPIPSFEPGGFDGIIFHWEIGERALKRQFPNYRPRQQRKQGMFRRGQQSDPIVEYIEYHDGTEFARWADETKLNGVEHKFGFNLFQQMKFINVPDEVWGHGAVEQAVGMVEMGNALKSLMFDAVLANVHPALVLVNPQKFGETIDKGAGGVIPVGEGGDAKYLHPPVEILQANSAFAAGNDANAKEAMFMPPVNFGVSPASSIVTGKAINELQGAGTGSVVEMVQGASMGSVLVGWNERAITIGQTMFADKKINLFGHIPPNTTEVNPRRFALSLKGSELVGSNRNEVVFGPYIELHEKLVMGLQALSAGLVSKKHVREQIGIPDSTAMEEEILVERVEEGVLGTILTAMETQAATPQETEQAGVGYLEGELPMPAMNVPAPVGPPGGPPSPVGGAAPSAASTPPPAPTQVPVQGGGEPSAATVDMVAAAIQTLQGLNGRVFLIGEIVQQGQTTDDIEVAVTDPKDRDVIARGLPQWRGMVFFTIVDGEPAEQYVEVTPGKDITPGGAEPSIDDLMGAAA